MKIECLGSVYCISVGDLDEISEVLSRNDDDKRNQTMMQSAIDIFDHDEDERIVVNDRDCLCHNHRGDENEEIDEEEANGCG